MYQTYSILTPDIIITELDYLQGEGIKGSVKGRKYLIDALVHGSKYTKKSSIVLITDIYPLNITSVRGAPTSKDFIEYCLEKIKENFK